MRPSSVPAILLAASLVAGALIPPERATADVLAGTNESVLARQPQVEQQAQGDGSIIGLQYADPAEQMVVMDPPQPSSQGDAQLQHPLLIPNGRGIQPNLVLTYDSSGGSSWVGTGWDLSVGAISVDSRWGVPRFDAHKESETYVFDGQELSPTAVRTNADWQNRVTDRSDFTLRAENVYDLIIRHGDSPKDYWWEVRDKMGGIRWYGGFPDDGGPDVNAVSSKYTSLKQDPSAILFDDKGNAYRWALSAQRDVGVNLIRYFYETVPGKRVGSADASVGKELYLKSIRYTGAASVAPAPPDDAAYEVRFLRDADISPAPAARKDVLVSGRGGFLEVTSDLLRRVEVRFGKPNGGAPRSYDQLSRAYNLNYQEGAFGKSLLKSVDQIGSDGKVYGTHQFNYYDEVRDATGAYHGFGTPVAWTTGTDNLQQNVLSPVNVSVLGGSETNSGDVHAYIGFNPLDPTKEGSFGGAFTINGGATESLAEFLDINGDGLPDKVFREGGAVWYRLNTSGPNLPAGTPATFGDKHPVVGLSTLSTEADVGLAAGAEAHLGVDAQFVVSGDVTIGEDYFADANGDGLPDFVSAGTVFFNHVDSTTGNPTFEASSANTQVPISVSTTTLPVSQQITDLENQRRQQSPLQDTIRRWVAPFTGTISIDAPATLDPSMPGDPTPAPPYKGDGVKVAIQHNDTQLWSATIATPTGGIATPTGVNSISVNKGDRIYFRLQSIDDGARDQVKWDPHISYTFTAPSDVNGLSQSTFRAADDFTTAGRPHTLGIAPLGGTVRFQGTLHKTKATTDDVTVQVLKNSVVVFSQLVSAATVNAAGIGLTTTDFAVAGPTFVNNTLQSDKLEVKIAADSPIDISALQLDYHLFYVKADNPSVPLTDSSGNPTIALTIPADIDIYPQNTLTAPNTPFVSGLTQSVTAHASLTVAKAASAGDVIVTVKNASGVVGKKTISVPASSLPQTLAADIPVTLTSGTNYWFDFSIRNPDISDNVTSHAVQLPNVSPDPPSVVNAAGRQGYFPISYRGWGYAGYNGDGTRAAQPIDETAFTVNPNDFPQNPTPPSGFNDPTYRDASKGPAYAFVPVQLQALDSSGKPITTPVPAWRGMKDDILGEAGLMRSSRTGVDSPSLGLASGAGVQAVRRVGIAAPVFSLNAGIGGATVGFGAGPSFGLQDYVDMNGDGFPDIVGPGFIKYTDPRGGFFDSGDGMSVVNQDTSFAVSGGLNASPIDVKSNSKGSVHTSQATAPVSGTGATQTSTSAAQSGGDAAESQYGFNVGGSVGIAATFTNPASTDPNLSDALNKTPVDQTAPFELTFVDVNGDGLPDRVRQTPQGVFVQFNLGYGFAPEVSWSGGGFENNESYAGSFGGQLGFTTPTRDFSAGLGLSESINLPRYQWVDVNGDGILDRLHKDTTSDQVTVAFGTNAGLLPDVPYGTMASGSFQLVGTSIPVGQQIAVTDTQGLGAGADFTVGIGPLCLVACYLIVNPGAHFDHSVSSNQIGLIDVDGDGYPDVLKSTADNQLSVSFNKAGRTNLLKTVTNPLGGTVSLEYKRDGNTTAQPNSLWTLSKVQVNDGRSGDGVDVKTSTYEYAGGRYNRLEREMLGYSSVIEHQLAADGSVLRSIEQSYLNNNVFDSGLLASQVLTDGGGKKLQEADTSWRLIDLKTHTDADLSLNGADPAGVRLLNLAVGAVQTRTDQFWYDSGGNVGEHTYATFDYDVLGNVVKQVDAGQTETTADDATANMIYTGCDNASTPGNYTRVQPQCPAPQLAGGVPPYWTPTRCPTWTSLPAALTITNAGGQILRQRNGAPALCDNSSVTDQRDFFGTGANDFAESFLSYDAWGNYNHIEYPQDANSLERTVDYVYDDYGHGNIATVTESRCAIANSPCSAPPSDPNALTANAVFDGRTGRIASRTDANGQVTSYAYDAFGRIESITGPYEQGSANKTVTFEYHADNPNYAYAIAHNFDVKHPGNTIDTATFIDGTGRQTQTKQDATLYTGVSTPATDAMVVSSAIDVDALGRAVAVRYPVSEPLGNIGTYNTDKSGELTTLTWDLLDRQTRVEAPGPLVTTVQYSFGNYSSPAGFSAQVFKNTVVSPATPANPQGKAETSWVDVRGNVLAIDEGNPALRTDYVYDPMGQVVEVRDNGGNVSSYSYDLLGRRTSTQTPDGGLVEFQFDPADNMIGEVTPNLRNKHEQIAYSYDMGRLTGITYPSDSGTPNVAYTYGGPGAAGNGAGRVISAVDGARTQQLTYDPLGAVASEVATMNLHNGPSTPFTTSFTHDGFGRLLTVTYPDDEVLTQGYDSGGLLSSLEGVKGSIATDYLKRQEYDQFQNKRYQEFGNGVHTEFNFDPATLRLARQITTAPTRKIQDLNYTYDGVGNVLSLVNNADGPVSNLLGGPSKQTYTYDSYDRVLSAKGVLPVAPNKERDYTYAVTYDPSGNIATKNQLDQIGQATSNGLKNPNIFPATTYNLSPLIYKPASTGGPHQIASAGGNTYSYDNNGNFTQVVDSSNKVQRVVTWDAANRVRNINDSSSSSDYLYDAQGLLGVQRGPQGETAFVNNWFSFTNDGWFWRQIWADDERIAQATEQVDPTTGLTTLFRYYEHNDLQGSTNLVTDNTGLVFEHDEYFPSGELWVQEHDTTHRTPYRFIGDLNDEVRNLDVLGQRWYQPREQVFYSPEPMLYGDPGSIVDDPGLLPAYTYAESNALRMYDDDGMAPKNAQLKLSSRFSVSQVFLAWTQAKRQSRLWQSLVRLALTDRSDKLAAFTERFSAKPLLAIELNRTDKGFELQSAKAGFLIWDWSIFEKPAVPAGQKSAATSGSTPTKPGVGSAAAPSGGNAGGPPPIPPKPRKPLPPIPGRPTAASNANPNAGGPPPIPPKPAALRGKPIAPSGKSTASGGLGGAPSGGPKPQTDSAAP